jgi:hypothetical protein
MSGGAAAAAPLSFTTRWDRVGRMTANADANLRRGTHGAAAGAAAAMLWALQQPLDKRVFGSRYDDIELLGKLVTRGPAWRAIGLAFHAANGAAFGATFALARPHLPGSPLAQAVTAALAENFGFWPLARLIDRFHPARRELDPLAGNGRALAQATWRHLVFGVGLGILEPLLNRDPIPSSQLPASATGRHS